MKLPEEFSDKSEWVLVGPMGPELPEELRRHPVMAVDGGAHFARTPEVWIGDSDSYREVPGAGVQFPLPENKDASDFSCALSLLREQKRLIIHLWGFSGGRKDHELFVWGEALRFLEEHPESRMIIYDPKGRVETHLLAQGQWRFQGEGTFSLGSLSKTRVRLTGAVRYPITQESWLPPLSSWGLSNVGSGEILLDTGGALFIHFPGEA